MYFTIIIDFSKIQNILLSVLALQIKQKNI